MSNIIFKNGTLSDIDENLGIVSGYGSIFGNVDSDMDIIEKGAYKRTLKNNGNRVKYIYNHQIDKPIGRMKELVEDEKGLKFTAEIPKTTFGKEVLELMKYEVINENSVGIQVLKDDYNKEDGIRSIKEVKLYEISAVTLAANDQAKILEVKGKTDDSDYYTKRFNNLIKFIRKGNITDELGYLIEYELEMLKSLIVREKSHQSIDKDRSKIHPKANKESKQTDSIYNYMFNKL